MKKLNPWKDLVLITVAMLDDRGISAGSLPARVMSLADINEHLREQNGRLIREKMDLLAQIPPPKVPAPSPTVFDMNALIIEKVEKETGLPLEMICSICGAHKSAHKDVSPEGVPGHQIRMPGAHNDGVWHAFQPTWGTR